MYIRCFYCYFSSIEMFLNNLFSLYLIFDLLRFVFDEILFHFFQTTNEGFHRLKGLRPAVVFDILHLTTINEVEIFIVG